MKNYTRFSVTSLPFNADILSGLLWELPIAGITEEENYLDVFVNEDSGVNIESITGRLDLMKRFNLIESYEVSQETFADKNWNEEWEKNLNVIEVTNKIVIKPSFKDYEPKQGQIILEIDPKMSFGTGEHATTRLILKLMEKYARSKSAVLDVGSGTGVLSICAAKMLAGKVIAIDNNEWCFLNGKENIIRNNVGDAVDVRLCEIEDVAERNFDLILANINKHILSHIVDELVERIAYSGTLILSGILITDKEDILKKYVSAGLKFADSVEEDEWCGLVFEKMDRTLMTRI